MQVINPNNTEHTLKFVPRYLTNFNSFKLLIFNESTQEETDANVIYNSEPKGYFEIGFNLECKDSDRFSFKVVLDDIDTIYRGKIIATAENLQEFKADTNEFNYYE